MESISNWEISFVWGLFKLIEYIFRSITVLNLCYNLLYHRGLVRQFLTQIKGVMLLLPHPFEKAVNLKLFLRGICYQLSQSSVFGIIFAGVFCEYSGYFRKYCYLYFYLWAYACWLTSEHPQISVPVSHCALMECFDHHLCFQLNLFYDHL